MEKQGILIEEDLKRLFRRICREQFLELDGQGIYDPSFVHGKKRDFVRSGSPGSQDRVQVAPRGHKVDIDLSATGYMITSIDINATFAQNIRPGGPMWMLEGHNEGDLIVRCGGTTPLAKRLDPDRWYDFR